MMRLTVNKSSNNNSSASASAASSSSASAAGSAPASAAGPVPASTAAAPSTAPIAALAGVQAHDPRPVVAPANSSPTFAPSGIAVAGATSSSPQPAVATMASAGAPTSLAAQLLADANGVATARGADVKPEPMAPVAEPNVRRRRLAIPEDAEAVPDSENIKTDATAAPPVGSYRKLALTCRLSLSSLSLSLLSYPSACLSLV
jgi:hypothetical protein